MPISSDICSCLEAAASECSLLGRPGGRGCSRRPLDSSKETMNDLLPSGLPRSVASRIRSAKASSSMEVFSTSAHLRASYCDSHARRSSTGRARESAADWARPGRVCPAGQLCAAALDQG